MAPLSHAMHGLSGPLFRETNIRAHNSTTTTEPPESRASAQIRPRPAAWASGWASESGLLPTVPPPSLPTDRGRVRDAAVCRPVAGLGLAIELAAARNSHPRAVGAPQAARPFDLFRASARAKRDPVVMVHESQGSIQVGAANADWISLALSIERLSTCLQSHYGGRAVV